MTGGATPLQQTLARQIVELIRRDRLEPGERLPEARLARTLNVSRSPVRAAIDILAREGIVRREPNRGPTLARVPEGRDGGAPDRPEDDHLVALARLRRSRALGDQFTEAELMRLMALDRSASRRLLGKLESLSLVARKSGYGWQFRESLHDARAKAESYRFRILVETAAILEPGFALDPDWIGGMRERHVRMAREPWVESSSVALFEMNAEFHLGVCAGSGNRYLTEAIRRQNQLRRLNNYHWRHGAARVQVSCAEHLEILDRLERGENEVAAALMRRHLEGASPGRVVPPGDAPASGSSDAGLRKD